jgi:hypothetical protein
MKYMKSRCGKSQTRVETSLRTNLGDKIVWDPFFLLCTVFILTFDFAPSLIKTGAQYLQFVVFYG